MKARAVLLAVALAQCTGSSPPAPGPAASPVPAAGGSGPGPAVGAALPPFEAPDQDGKRLGFEALRGPNGLLLKINRSVVW